MRFTSAVYRCLVYTSGLGDERRRIVGWIVVVVLLVMVIAGAPTWPYSREWGYGPSGVLGIVLVVVLVLLLSGFIPQTL